MVIGEWRALIGVLLITSAHILKARKEEAWLGARFVKAYEDYRNVSGFLLPRLRVESRDPKLSP
jgi:protein-S-isoprenylcysteine O-methyltransferase Ste14